MSVELITVADAVKLLGIDKLQQQGKIKYPDRMIAEMVRRGELESRRVGRFPMIVQSSVSRILKGE